MVNQIIPKWLEKYVDDRGLARIETAVRAVEKKSSVEIVPVIVHRSARNGTGFPVIALALMLFGVLLYPAAPVWAEACGAAVATIAAWFLAHVPAIERLITGKLDRDHQAGLRAQVEFHRAGLESTQGSTGILLFLSFAERHAVVLADKKVAAILPPSTWKEVVTTLTAALSKKDLAGGLESALRLLEPLVAPHFPVALIDVNELDDRLRILE